MKKNFAARAATLAVALLMISGLVACGNEQELIPDRPKENEVDESGNIKKPESIFLMSDTMLTEENKRSSFAEEYQRLTGIELKIEQPAHNQYYEKINLSFAGGTAPDVMEIGNTNYPSYASYGALFDMTKAWDESDLKAQGIVDESFVDALKIDGKLYGFPMTRGNGTVTYVRGDWMKELNIQNPTNYDEFIAMLKTFRDEKGVIPVTASGLINSETPYDIYLREFYQDAHPDFYKNENGKYVDGMTEPQMIDALQRLKDAFGEGLLDREIITNKTSTCRNKFYEGKVACFNYWAGLWNKTLYQDLKKQDSNGEVVPLAPIKEAKYLERPPLALAITTAAKNPYGIFKYFIEYSHDGGEGQMLFTHGVKDIHYKVNPDGSVEALPPPSTPDSSELMQKAWFGPELSIVKFDDPIEMDQRIESSLKLFNENSEINPVPRMTPEIADVMTEISTVREEVITKIVTKDWTPQEGIDYYKQRLELEIGVMMDELSQFE